MSGLFGHSDAGAEARADIAVERRALDTQRIESIIARLNTPERTEAHTSSHSSALSALKGSADGKKEVDADMLNAALIAQLKADGLIDANATRYSMKSTEDRTQVNGHALSREQHRAYRAFLMEGNVCGDADIWINVKGDTLQLEMKDGRSTTKVTRRL